MNTVLNLKGAEGKTKDRGDVVAPLVLDELIVIQKDCVSALIFISGKKKSSLYTASRR